jgi:hypothetical protein
MNPQLPIHFDPRRPGILGLPVPQNGPAALYEIALFSFLLAKVLST